MKNTVLVLLFITFSLASCRNTESGKAPEGFENGIAKPAATQQLTDAPNSALQDAQEESDDPTTDVWVCKSAGARKYHLNGNCGGLGRCKHKIEKMTLDQAEAVGLTRCGYKKCN